MSRTIGHVPWQGFKLHVALVSSCRTYRWLQLGVADIQGYAMASSGVEDPYRDGCPTIHLYSQHSGTRGRRVMNAQSQMSASLPWRKEMQSLTVGLDFKHIIDGTDQDTNY